MRVFHFILLCLALAGASLVAPLRAAPREVRLYAAPELVQSGLLKYVLPRFKLKTQIRVELVGERAAGEVIVAGDAPEGVAPLAEGPQGMVYAWAPATPEPASDAARLLAWLASDIGRRTLSAYRLDGQQLFFALQKPPEAEQIIMPDGDPVAGRVLAYRNCGRCHVIGPDNRMQGIESTPSFGVLRALPDWQERFISYYARPPHPPFTRIESLTEPPGTMAPPAIAPLALSLDEYNAILAFVARISPADLGAPLVMRR